MVGLDFFCATAAVWERSFGSTSCVDALHTCQGHGTTNFELMSVSSCIARSLGLRACLEVATEDCFCVISGYTPHETEVHASCDIATLCEEKGEEDIFLEKGRDAERVSMDLENLCR